MRGFRSELLVWDGVLHELRWKHTLINVMDDNGIIRPTMKMEYELHSADGLMHGWTSIGETSLSTIQAEFENSRPSAADVMRPEQCQGQRRRTRETGDRSCVRLSTLTHLTIGVT